MAEQIGNTAEPLERDRLYYNWAKEQAEDNLHNISINIGGLGEELAISPDNDYYKQKNLGGFWKFGHRKIHDIQRKRELSQLYNQRDRAQFRLDNIRAFVNAELSGNYEMINSLREQQELYVIGQEKIRGTMGMIREKITQVGGIIDPFADTASSLVEKSRPAAQGVKGIVDFTRESLIPTAERFLNFAAFEVGMAGAVGTSVIASGANAGVNVFKGALSIPLGLATGVHYGGAHLMRGITSGTRGGINAVTKIGGSLLLSPLNAGRVLFGKEWIKVGNLLDPPKEPLPGVKPLVNFNDDFWKPGSVVKPLQDLLKHINDARNENGGENKKVVVSEESLGRPQSQQERAQAQSSASEQAPTVEALQKQIAEISKQMRALVPNQQAVPAT